MNHHDKFKNRLAVELERRNWTMNRLANCAGITQSTLSNLVNRPNAVPKLDTIFLIAQGLGISVTELLDFPPYNVRPDGTDAAKHRDKWEELGDALTEEEKNRVRRILTEVKKDER